MKHDDGIPEITADALTAALEADRARRAAEAHAFLHGAPRGVKHPMVRTNHRPFPWAEVVAAWLGGVNLHALGKRYGASRYYLREGLRARKLYPRVARREMAA